MKNKQIALPDEQLRRGKPTFAHGFNLNTESEAQRRVPGKKIPKVDVVSKQHRFLSYTFNLNAAEIVPLLGSDENREYLLIQNTGANTAYIGFGTSPSNTGANAVEIPAGTSMELRNPCPNNDINANAAGDTQLAILVGLEL